MNFRYLYARLRQEKFPVRFLLSRVLWKTRCCGFLHIRRQGYLLHFSPSAVAALLWVERDFGTEEEAVLASFLRAGDIFVDVGANIGYLSLAATVLVGDTGSVYAFEPHPRTCAFLQKNIELNRCRQVKVFQTAVGSEVGQVSLSSGHSDDQNQVHAVGGLLVPMTRLDRVLTGYELAEIGLLKIDVEGYEKFVLLGMGRLLERTRAILFESSERHFAHFGYSTDDVVALLTSAGFMVGKMNGHGHLSPLPPGYRSNVCENLVAVNRSLCSRWAGDPSVA